jgi:hypothetical protein
MREHQIHCVRVVGAEMLEYYEGYKEYLKSVIINFSMTVLVSLTARENLSLLRHQIVDIAFFGYATAAL